MNLSKCRLTGLILLACLGTSSHAASTPDTAAKVNRVIEASGIAHAARQYQPAILQSFSSPMPGVPDNIRLALREAASQSFKAEPIVEKVRARLSSAMTVRHLDDTLAWLDGPLGRKLTDLENAALEPSAAPQIEAYGRQIEKSPPSKSRSELVTKLLVTSGTDQVNAHMTESTVLATALGINAAQPAQARAPNDVIRKKINAAMPDLLKKMEDSVRVYMLYTYRSASDRDLEAYLKFLGSPSGAAYTKAVVDALRDAMNEALAAYMQAIPKALAKHGHSVGT